MGITYSNTLDFSKQPNKLLLWFILPFTLLFIFSFSFPHQLIPDIGYYTSGIFKPMATFTAQSVFGYHDLVPELISDSILLYSNTFNLILLSLLITFLVNALSKSTAYYNHIFYWFLVFIRYYLALQLFVYGFNKVFKWQFYLPEPNTLFTTVGDSYKDILYWSSMGTSWWYSFFTGSLEVLAAALLLWQRTLLLGALLSVVVMANVFMINIGFDISVKLYSLFVLFLSFVILLPWYKKLLLFFFQSEYIPPAKKETISIGISRNVYLAFKTLFILLLVADSTWMYFRSGNFNDDTAPRPPFFGAYKVQTFTENGQPAQALLDHPSRWKRVFVHSKGYFIIQYMDDEMMDMEMAADTVNHIWLLKHKNKTIATNYTILNDSTILFKGNFGTTQIEAELRKLNLSKLNLLQNEFSWTIDTK